MASHFSKQDQLGFHALLPDIEASDSYRSQKLRDYLKSMEHIVVTSTSPYGFYNRHNIPNKHQQSLWVHEMQQRLAARPSTLPGSGLGLFLVGARDLPPDSFVCEYNGFGLTGEEFDELDKVKNDFETGIQVPQLEHGGGMSDGFVLVGHPNTFGPLLNDACRGKESCLLPMSAHAADKKGTTAAGTEISRRHRPNVEFRVNKERVRLSHATNTLQPGCIELYTTCTVTPGDELFLNYGSAFWDNFAISQEILCTACHDGTYDEGKNAILLCDTPNCDGAFHLYCLTPVLERVPSGDWICPNCEAGADSGTGVGGLQTKQKSEQQRDKSKK